MQIGLYRQPWEPPHPSSLLVRLLTFWEVSKQILSVHHYVKDQISMHSRTLAEAHLLKLAEEALPRMWPIYPKYFSSQV